MSRYIQNLQIDYLIQLKIAQPSGRGGPARTVTVCQSARPFDMENHMDEVSANDLTRFMSDDSFPFSACEDICLPHDLSAVQSSREAYPTNEQVSIPVALFHPAIAFDVLSSQNIESLISQMSPQDQHKLLVSRFFQSVCQNESF
jgi:hypothetical protein